MLKISINLSLKLKRALLSNKILMGVKLYTFKLAPIIIKI
jgi:hypothetical protein